MSELRQSITTGNTAQLLQYVPQAQHQLHHCWTSKAVHLCMDVLPYTRSMQLIDATPLRPPSAYPHAPPLFTAGKLP